MDAIGVKQPEEVPVDTSKPKVFGVGLVGILLAGLLGYFLNLSIFKNNSASLLPALLLAAAFLSVFLLQTIFIKSKRILNLVVLLDSLVLAGIAAQSVSSLVFLAWFLLVLFLLRGSKMGGDQMENQIKIKFFQIERAVMPSILTALALFISVAYVAAGRGVISEQNINSILLPAEPIIQRLYFKDFSLDMTVNKLVDSLVSRQLGVQAAALPASARNSLISQTVGQLSKQASQYGISFKGTDKIADVLYKFLSMQVKKIPESFLAAIPIGIGAALFLTLKGVGFVLNWAVAILAYLIYQLALATGFARLALESRSREIIILK